MPTEEASTKEASRKDTNPEEQYAEEVVWHQLIDDLHGRLAEAEEILQAISAYKVDAFVIRDTGEERVYTLSGSDRVYQVILDAINEGAATLGVDGTILYCNPAFAALLQLPVQQVIGTSLVQRIIPNDLSIYTALIEQGSTGRSRGEVHFLTAEGAVAPVLLSCSALKLDEFQCICLVATDLTEQKRQTELVIRRTSELLETNQRLEREIEERRQTEDVLSEARQRLSQIREAERLVLARDLHDGPLQDVVSMAFDLVLLAQTLHNQEQVAKISSLNQTAQKIARQLRLMTQTLRPPVLAHLGLAAALRSHVKQVQDTRETPSLSCITSDEVWHVPEESALALLRIAQQAVQNALQHAHANHIEVRLHYEHDHLRLEIEDDGQGFATPYDRVKFARDGHLGVVGIEERCEAIRGQFELISQPGKGTRVRVNVPRPAEEREVMAAN